MQRPMPAIFFGHGNPMNALTQNNYTKSWARIGTDLPRPKAILAVSAHWYMPKTAVTISTTPKTVHDFGGFPKELFQVQYPAAGDPELARHVQNVLAPTPVDLDNNWGLDHGTWSVLMHVFPKADIPIVQLSINSAEPASFHFGLGQKLARLRNEGILIVGSGNLIHNLRTYAWDQNTTLPYDWADHFEQTAKQMIIKRDFTSLVHYETLGKAAMLSAPTPDHLLPLLYILGTCQQGDDITFPVEGYDGGSISMLSVRVG